MGASQAGRRTDLVYPRGIRWLAVATGCFSTAALLPHVTWVSIVASPLALGAIVQPRFPRLGRYLIAAGAFVVTWMVLPLGVMPLVGAVTVKDLLLPLHERDFLPLGLLTALIVSPFLIIWCDAALVIEQRKRARRARKT